jgi:hypothetical protein
MTQIVIDKFYVFANWQRKFAVIPRRCYLSKRWLWIEWMYHGKAFYLATGDMYEYENRWHSEADHIFWLMTSEYA